MGKIRKPPGYLRHVGQDGRVRARIVINGRSIYLGPYGSPESHAEYERVINEWRIAQARKEQDIPQPGSVRTVADLCAAFWIHAQKHYRHADGSQTSEVESYEQTLKPLQRLHGHTLIRDFGPIALKEVRAAMVSGLWMTDGERQLGKRKGRAGVAREVANQRIGRIRRMFCWGVENEAVPLEIYQRLCTVKGLQAGRTEARECPDVAPVPDAVVDATLKKLRPVTRAMVQVQRLTGMRPGEVCGLTADEIDRDGLRIDGVPIWIYRPSQHKTAYRGKRKAVAIGPQAQAVLLPFLENCQPGQRVFRPNMVRRDCGDRYTTASYGHRIRVVCERHGIPVFSPNQLRHSAATKVRHTFDLDSARAVLGHERGQESTTLIYASEDLQRAARVALQIG